MATMSKRKKNTPPPSIQAAQNDDNENEDLIHDDDKSSNDEDDSSHIKVQNLQHIETNLKKLSWINSICILIKKFLKNKKTKHW